MTHDYEVQTKPNETTLEEPHNTDESPSSIHDMASFSATPNGNKDQSIEETILHSNYFLNFE